MIVSAQGRAGATRGMAIQPGDTIVTGSGARAVLVHSKDFVTVSSNSRIRIPAEARESSITRFFQELGNAIFNVEKRNAPHFSVDTPYLAAVVKGTVFSVTVGADRSALQVTEGVVEVSTMDGGARELIRPGSIAMIAASDRYRLTISGDAARVVDSPARPPAPASTQTLPPASTAEPGAPAPVAAPTESSVPLGERISQAVESKPVDLALATNGVLSGLSPVNAAAAVIRDQVAVANNVESPRQGTGNADGPATGGADRGDAANPAPAGSGPSEATPDNSGGSSRPDPLSPDAGKAGDKSETGKPVPEADKGGKPGAGDADKADAGKPAPKDEGGKPGKDDAGKPSDKPDTGKPGHEGNKDGKPGKDDSGKPGDKPDSGKPGAKDEGGKPGKDDAGKPGAKDEGGKPGKDDAGKPAAKDEGGKPGKDDAGKPGAKDEGGKPGKDDAGKPGAKDEGGKPGKDDAGKPAAKDEGGKPGKDDAGKPDHEDDKSGKDDADKPDTHKPGGKPDR
jgi:hypothetical protein